LAIGQVNDALRPAERLVMATSFEMVYEMATSRPVSI
jgi:hypothetical protein